MIVMDIETSGLTGREGIWQIGAIVLGTERYFIQDGRIDDEDHISEGALKVTGKTEAELRDPKKQSQRELIVNYLDWVKDQPERIFVGENPGFDAMMIQDKAIKYGIENVFQRVHGHRTMDLHTIAQERYKRINGKYLLIDGKDAMNLSAVLKLCGLPDNRRNVKLSEIVQEGKPHNAIEDCQLEGECFWRIENGENLFPEYSNYPVPEALIK